MYNVGVKLRREKREEVYRGILPFVIDILALVFTNTHLDDMNFLKIHIKEKIDEEY